MQAISKDATDIIAEIEKRIKTERQFYHFNVDILHIQAVKEFIKTTDYEIIQEDKLFFTIELFLKRKVQNETTFSNNY